MNKEKEFYLVEELAEKLRISNMTIYRYIKAGKLKAYKIGRQYRIMGVDLINTVRKNYIKRF